MSAIHWFTNDEVAEAVAAARSSGRPLLLDFWDPTCLGCAKLFAATYADPDVDALLAGAFVCLKYDTRRVNGWFRELTGSVAHLWTPDVVIASDRLTQLRRLSGYLPPRRFAAHLRIGLALWHLHRGRPAPALDLLAAVAGAEDADGAGAEALYWAGVAAYRTGGLAGLEPHWARLQARYPGSDWALRADCLDVEIPAGGFVPGDPSTVRLLAAAGGHTRT